MENDSYLLFVYGTLKSNHKANYLLRSSQFYGKATTLPEYSLYSCGSYPAMVEDANGMRVEGEVYKISQYVKEDLDVYEGVHYNLYEFKEINLLNKNDSWGKVYGYLFLGNLENSTKIDRWT